MGSSPPASSMRPDDVRAHRILEDGGTRGVGSGRIQEIGNSRYALIPDMVANMMDAEAGQDVDIFVNFEENLVIHRFPPSDDGPE